MLTEGGKSKSYGNAMHVHFSLIKTGRRKGVFAYFAGTNVRTNVWHQAVSA
jgi:hypothetical protein